MTADNFDELAGRIEGLSRAVLGLTAALEMKEVIDGPRLSKAWTASLVPHIEDTRMRRTARDYLRKLNAVLEDARSARQSKAGL